MWRKGIPPKDATYILAPVAIFYLIIESVRGKINWHYDENNSLFVKHFVTMATDAARSFDIAKGFTMKNRMSLQGHCDTMRNGLDEQ